MNAFDISLAFLPVSGSGMTFNGYVLGDRLGDPASGDATDLSQGLIGDDLIQIGLASTLSSSDLSALQQDTFTLVTLEFTAGHLVGSESAIFIGVPELLNPAGERFFVEVMLDPVLVTTVPVPAGLWLLISALGMTSTALARPSND